MAYVNTGVTSFPTTPVANSSNVDSAQTDRVANATAAGFYEETWTASAEL